MRILLAGLLLLALTSCATRQPDAPIWAGLSKEIRQW